MSDTPLGKLASDTADRDAVHIAIAPVTAACVLVAGQPVGMLADGTCGPSVTPIGIVDPFLTEAVEAGQRFYLCLRPNTVVGMRHHWSHPAFPSIAERTDIQESELWLKKYAAMNSPYDSQETAYVNFMARVRSRGEVFYHGTDLHNVTELDRPSELFRHLSIVLGRRVGSEDFTYSCSC